MLSLKGAFEKGLKKELALDMQQVAGWRVTSIALHMMHLNTALIAVVFLDMSGRDFEDHYAEMVQRRRQGTKDLGPTFEDRIELLEVGELVNVIREEAGKSRWHDTALLRLWHAHRAAG